LEENIIVFKLSLYYIVGKIYNLKDKGVIKVYAIFHSNKYNKEMDEYKRIIDKKISLMKL
jgi:hypothetical protein